MDEVNEILSRGVVNVIPSKEKLVELLSSGKTLNIYLGIDPTATKIHLGHAVSLRKLQSFATLGHNVTFLIGDFTALVGDTSDKDSERPVLTPEEIEENFKTYKEQAGKLLDFSKVHVRHNSEWLSKLTYPETLRLKQKFSLNDFIARELIKKRLTEGKSVRLDETEYPVMQGYDSYMLDTDIQIGGPDQTFNMQAGRTLIKSLSDKESFVLATDYLTGTDGRKMSKSWGNAIWLNDPPEDMYRKIMSVQDDLIIQYFTLATKLSVSEIDKIKSRLESGENPMDIKKELAQVIVSELHSKVDAEKAGEEFKNTVQDGEAPKEIPEFEVKEGQDIIDILVDSGLIESKSEARRVIEQGGVEVDGNKFEILNLKLEIHDGVVVRIGKHKFLKLTIR